MLKSNMSNIGNQSLITNKPSPVATGLLLAGLLVAYATIFLATPSEMVGQCAFIVGISISLSLAYEVKFAGLRNAIRVDNAGIVALYFLTLFEFLFPQPFFNELVTGEQTRSGLHLVLLGLGSIAIGRHLGGSKPLKKLEGRVAAMTERELFWFAVVCFALGHLHMWIAVGFNPIEWLSQMAQQRFTQDWQRGRLGGLSTLLGELYWLTYIVPAIAGFLWVRRKFIPAWMLLGIGGILVILLFGGISLGARYRFAFYILSFLGGLLLSIKTLKLSKLLAIGVPIAAVFIFLTFFIVNYRNLGLKNVAQILINDEFQGYSGARDYFYQMSQQQDHFKFIVDRNMYPLSVLPSHFPDRHPFLEDEILLSILIRPVPRALWPAKPESLSITTESILGVESATIASTIVGEGFMAYGVAGSVVFCLVFGALLGFWNRIPISFDNPTLVIFYTLGFVWCPLAIRSVIWISVGILPVIALFVYSSFLIPFLRGGRKLSRGPKQSAETAI